MRLSNEKALRIALGIVLAGGIGMVPWAGGRMDRAHVANVGVAVASKHILTDAEIDAVDVSVPVIAPEPTQEERWARYSAFWQARAAQERSEWIEQHPAQAAAQVVAEAIDRQTAQAASDAYWARYQASQDNLTALMRSHASGY